MIGLVLPLHLGSLGATAAVVAHQPGATPQLVRLQAPGRPRVDLLLTPKPVDLEVPAPLDLSVQAEALGELLLALSAQLTLTFTASATPTLRLVLDARAEVRSTLQAEALVETPPVDWEAWTHRVEAERREEEELRLLEVL